MELLNKEGNIVQLIIVCEDIEDFKQVSRSICTIFPENILPHVYYSLDGAMKRERKKQTFYSLLVYNGHIRFFSSKRVAEMPLLFYVL